METHSVHEARLNGVHAGDSIRLEMNTDYLQRRFCMTVGDTLEEEKLLDEYLLENVYYLCDEGIRMGKRFTGAMLGIYAYAGRDLVLEAEFKELTYIAMS